MSILTATSSRQRLLFWAAIGILSASSLISFLSTQRLIASMSGLEHTQKVLIETNRFVSHL